MYKRQNNPRACPETGYQSHAEPMEGSKTRYRSETFADHYSQARQFYISQTETEQKHMRDAFAFELSKVERLAIRERVVSHLLNVDKTLAESVAQELGFLEMPEPAEAAMPTREDLPVSDALSILKNAPSTFKGRKLGILVSDGIDADFDFQTAQYIDYKAQSSYKYPNLNTALFGEQIIYLRDNLSITPGFRLEHIKTESEGYYKKVFLDAAGNLLLNETIPNNETRKRSFVLFGVGLSYKPTNYLEFYNNVSQNYRSVTFADISIVNPAFAINPNITDEKGYNIDFGVRGIFNKTISYDLSIFGLFYNDRIGFVQKVFEDGNVKSERGNVGNASIYGFESLVDVNLTKLLNIDSIYGASLFANTSIIDSKYTASSINGITGKKVEFVPKVNLKTGFKFTYKDFASSIQYTFLSEQFTDASNSIDSNLSGIIGVLPSYDVLDLSFSYKYQNFKIESGINNVLNSAYFTRRATGYPGPGICLLYTSPSPRD